MTSVSVADEAEAKTEDVNPVPNLKTSPNRLASLPASAKVFVIPIDDRRTTAFGMIDDWQAAFVKRKLAEAKKEKADLAILEVASFGGSVASCADIVKAVQDSGIPTVAFVNNKAISGGAFVSVGCDAIYMVNGSVIGDAMPVQMGQSGGPELPESEELKEKLRSPVRGFFKALGQSHGYPVAILMAMVDPNLGVLEVIEDGRRKFLSQEEFDALEKARPKDPNVKMRKVWCKKGQLLTLDTVDAIACGLAKGVANSIEDVCKGLGVTSPQTTVVEVTWAENVNRYLSHPAVSLILVVIALIGIFFELKSPGTGVGFIAALLAMGAFFWIQLVMDRSGALEIVMFGIGMLLLALEVFVFPGLGAAGIAGFGLVLLSILLSFLPSSASLWSLFQSDSAAPWWEREAMYNGLKWGFATVFIAIFGALFLLVYGVNLPVLSRLATKDAITGSSDPAPRVEALASLEGKTGQASSTLRPAGKALIEGQVVDVISQGEYIEAGERIKVVRVRDGVVTVDRA